MNVLLISTYELGRQPFGLASPAAWLKHAGARVTCFDLAIDHLDQAVIQSADLIAIYVPMHTATRLAIPLAQRVKQANPRAHLCFYGLYAPMNEKFLREVGADSIIGGEFETQLVLLYRRLESIRASTVDWKSTESQTIPSVSLERQQFIVPDRSGLPDPPKYARLIWNGGTHLAGYTEATRGCKHLCRHCPIVPVYKGQFRVVQKEVVLADIRQQIERGAQHITFGDPDFFNGPTHSLALVRALHQEFPTLTYDVTIKIEHLLKQANQLPVLRDTGCLFVTSAVEAVDDRILEIFAKRHTREDFIRVVALFRELEMVLQPTLVAFNPWISIEGYRELLALIAELDLIDNVPSIQYAIRLLVPAGSRLLELPDTRKWLGAFDAERLCYTWAHPDPRVDKLQEQVLEIVQKGGGDNASTSRREIFKQIWETVQFPLPPGETSVQFRSSPAEQVEEQVEELRLRVDGLVSKPIPHLSEPWYC